MKDRINQYLTKLEEEKDIKILLATETGSRAWGFPSLDSDFDVRLIYMHKKDWYLSLNERKDTINRMFENNEIDIAAWDLRKSLRLLPKSNAALLERIYSPIVYRKEAAFLTAIQKLAQSQYARIAVIHHYLSMAKKFMEALEQEKQYSLKQFFYAFRSAIVCKWILEKEQVAPLDLLETLDALPIAEAHNNRIKEFIALKATVTESYRHSGEEALFVFMKTCIAEAEQKRQSLPGGNKDMEALNAFFLQTLDKYDY